MGIRVTSLVLARQARKIETCFHGVGEDVFVGEVFPFG